MKGIYLTVVSNLCIVVTKVANQANYNIVSHEHYLDLKGKKKSQDTFLKHSINILHSVSNYRNIYRRNKQTTSKRRDVSYVNL